MRYPIGIQSFEKIRLGEYTYVDKTALIHQLVNTSNYYFLSRPRRFGKSLLISTLEAYFNGQQELFKGLEMEQLEKEWTKYPVLHLDLNTPRLRADRPARGHPRGRIRQTHAPVHRQRRTAERIP